MDYILLTDDQHFLLQFILGTYFAPDLKKGSHPKSALQRHIEGLPQYNPEDLVGSQIKTTILEKVYYHVMRKAEESLVVKQPMLLEYIHGSVPITLEGSVTYLQFNDLFPPILHRRSQRRDQHCTIDNIVFVSNPETKYMKPYDVQRFKILTGLKDIHIDWERVMQHKTIYEKDLCNGKALATSELNDSMQHTNIQHLECIPSAQTCPDGQDMEYILLTDDQHFLLHFILGTYFAPDLKKGSPPKSALQRHIEGLPQYNPEDLVGSQIKTTIMEKVYYHVMRKADESLVVKQPMLLEYIHGSVPITLECSVTYLQFNDLFPPVLHRRSQRRDQHGTIDNIVFISNPETKYMKPYDVQRFNILTGLKDIHLDWERVMRHKTIFEKDLCNGKAPATSELNDSMPHINIQHLECIPSTQTCPDVISQSTSISGQDIDQGMLFLPSCPTKEQWSNLVAAVSGSSALTGSVASCHFGPALGLIDIGESEDSYLFRVTLPGVKRDARDFSCEVGSDGAVIIKGVTVTGERRVEKFSRVFEMRTQNLCPPGPFCIYFNLPGPVDPQKFHGTFATDGILEGIAPKATRNRS